jgi:hypothetical protein
VRAREDGGRGLALQLLHRQPRVLARPEQGLALLDERAHERAQLVQRRPSTLDVLLEGER